MPNGAKANAGRTTTTCWKQHSWICNAGHPRVNSSGDILEFPTKGGNQTVTGAQDSYWGQACDFAKLGLGSGPRFCDSQSTCRKKYSGKYRVIDFAKSQRLCRLLRNSSRRDQLVTHGKCLFLNAMETTLLIFLFIDCLPNFDVSGTVLE